MLVKNKCLPIFGHVLLCKMPKFLTKNQYSLPKYHKTPECHHKTKMKVGLKSWDPNKNNKVIKNYPKNIFWGCLGAPKTPYFAILGIFGGPQTPPKNIFRIIFYGLIIFFDISAFQCNFPFCFMMTLRSFKILGRENWFFG